MHAAREVPENGNYVSWRELNLALGPVVSGMANLNAKMDILMQERSEAAGRDKAHIHATDTRRFWLTIAATLLCGSIVAMTAWIVSIIAL